MDDDTKVMLFLLGTGATIGALIGLGLSFTALSPLVMGGIVAAVPATLLSALISLDDMKEGISKKGFFLGACNCATSAAIGVGFAAVAMAIFPNVTLGMGSAGLAGAVIGVIAPTVAFFATIAIALAAEKVNECIISPIVERLSPKEGKYNLSAK